MNINYIVFPFYFSFGSFFLANCKVAFDLDKHNIPGVPDGMTMDSDGNLWVAVFNGARILHVNPRNGTLLNTINFPTKQVFFV